MTSSFVLNYKYKNTILTTELPHVAGYVRFVYESKKYQHWVDSLDETQVELRKYTLTGIPTFAGKPSPEKLLFFTGTAEVYDKTMFSTRIISNVSMNRGGSCACLVIVEVLELGKRFVALTEQMRWITGGRRIEVVAGMKNEATNELEGPIIQELKEEMGIEISLDDPMMRPLGKPFWTSQGLLDEKIDPWVLEIDVTKEKYEEMLTNIYGIEKEGENIRIKFFEFNVLENILSEIGDAKLEVLFSRYMRESRINNTKNTCWNQTAI
jgi:hypothetical protein